MRRQKDGIGGQKDGIGGQKDGIKGSIEIFRKHVIKLGRCGDPC